VYKAKDLIRYIALKNKLREIYGLKKEDGIEEILSRISDDYPFLKALFSAKVILLIFF